MKGVGQREKKLEKEEEGIHLFSLGDSEWKEGSQRQGRGESKKRDEIKAVLAEREVR